MTRERIALYVLSIFSLWIVSCLGLSVDVVFQHELIERIRALEKQGQHQAEKMQVMESMLAEQDQMLANQAKVIINNKQRIKEQNDRLVIQERMIVDNRQRIEEQDRKLALQERTIGDYKQRLEEQDQKLALQERRISDNREKVAYLEQNVVELKLKQDAAVAEDNPESNAEVSNDQANGIVRQERSELAGNRSESMLERRALLNAEGPIAFHAVIKPLAEVTHIGVNQKIVFPDVMVNLGGGYHNQHGIFIAPQPGIYIFSTSILSDYRNHVEIYVHLMKNGQVLATAYAHGDSGRHDQGSVTVVTQLAAGDEVWVSLYGPADTSLWGDYGDIFMGCLVVPL